MVIKTCGILGILTVLIAISGASDWLEGGYVSSGDHGDIGQYFTDPIFSSTGDHYVSPDPAVRAMQESLDRPISSPGPVVARPAATLSPTIAAGRWHLDLSEGKAIDLYLNESGSRLFGSGSIAFGQESQGATASGSILGSDMILDVVPWSGTELYSISLDISRLHLASSYSVFRPGAATESGTVRAIRAP